MSDSLKHYNLVISECKDIFLNKMKDYGQAWRFLRFDSVADQLYIKARRIRTIQDKRKQKVSDSIRSEYIGIINYAIIGLIQLKKKPFQPSKKLQLPGDLPYNYAAKLFNAHTANARKLYLDKTHDYGEAWKEMHHNSFTDLILVKLARMKQIEQNSGKTLISEGIDANLYDIINYAIFALMRLS